MVQGGWEEVEREEKNFTFTQFCEKKAHGHQEVKVEVWRIS